MSINSKKINSELNLWLKSSLWILNQIVFFLTKYPIQVNFNICGAIYLRNI